MPHRDTLRASDADREHVAERLQHAAAEGRLLAEELEQRLGAAFKSRTYGELDSVIADLPRAPIERRDSRTSTALARPAMALAFAVVAIAVIAAAVLVVTGVLAVWGMWILLAWWICGGRHRRRAMHRGRHWHGQAVSGRPEPRAWL